MQEERKVVTVLFCDLVGFTAASEAVDPEDVRARIRPYHALLRREIETYGGTVEKFIGDAVMAVFGAPVAHEDDVERAVRCGLRILEAIEELNSKEVTLALQVRVGINTGEAVVSLDARPEQGEGIVTGAVVNTASRLQGAAPVNGIAVSEATYRATERSFEFEELEPVTVKGKTAPLRLYRPLAPRARFGSDVIGAHTTPLVGRALEKSLLIGTFERAMQQHSCQLVTIVGEPGVGKSRVCAELLGHIEERPGPTRWRQGRCLPYGEGIAFWALGEIVKTECGILESDSPDEAARKLDQALPEADSDSAWLKARLAPLVGAGGEAAAQEESFAAWRRVLESWAEGRETVLVFEDLHWADEALLVLLEHLAEWAEGVPLLLLCTARPELYERHPGFGANARNAQRINLAPLTDEETAQLISALSERAVLSTETQRALLERAGGNPLYAEEFVRLLSDRGTLGGAVEVPDSVRALIAARLDTLPSERKSLLHDAAVLGKDFWAGALVEMGARDPRDVELALHELARKELVRPSRTSTMEGEAEYGFWHLLVRDVCYSQIPRAARAARHRAAAVWLEEKAGERVADLADVLAHHYVQALELARAAGQTGEVAELVSGAIRYLLLAGERALPLDVASAESSLATALELAPTTHPERTLLLERWAQAAQQQGRLHEAKDALEEALVVYRERDESVAAGRVLTALSTIRWSLGDPRHQEALIEAVALLEAQRHGPELVAAYAEVAGARFVGGAYEEVIASAERALELAEELGLQEQARALGYRGSARCMLGERQGLDDMRRALELAVAQGEGRTGAVIYANLAYATWLYEGPRASLAVSREGIDFCERRGITDDAAWIAAGRTTRLAESGDVRGALREAAPLAERLRAEAHLAFAEVRALQVQLHVESGTPEECPDPAEPVAKARESGVLELVLYAFAAAAQLLLAQSRREEARALLDELEHVSNARSTNTYCAALPRLVRTALALADRDLAARLVAGIEPKTPLAEHALAACRAQLAEAAGDPSAAAETYAEAAERWRVFGNVRERAYALLGQGRCLAALGGSHAEAPLREARELFASMGYKPALAETEALLADCEAAAV